MNKGLSIELLVQLFIVLEGLSIWKILKFQELMEATPSDFDEACKKKLTEDGSLRERVTEVTHHLNARDSFFWWKKVIDWMERPYAAIFIFIVFMVLSSNINIYELYFRLLMSFFLMLYGIVKFFLYELARRSYVEYKKSLASLSLEPINAPPANDFKGM